MITLIIILTSNSSIQISYGRYQVPPHTFTPKRSSALSSKLYSASMHIARLFVFPSVLYYLRLPSFIPPHHHPPANDRWHSRQVSGVSALTSCSLAYVHSVSRPAFDATKTPSTHSDCSHFLQRHCFLEINKHMSDVQPCPTFIRWSWSTGASTLLCYLDPVSMFRCNMRHERRECSL